MIYYKYDGSYGGFLSCVFECFERKEFAVRLQDASLGDVDLFAASRIILSDEAKSKRVNEGLKKHIGKQNASDFFRVFLSEDAQAIQYAFDIIVSIFQGSTNILENFGDEKVLYFAQTLRKVSRERHRMQAFIRFEKSADGLFFAVIAPDFNVLPLILSFFKNRYTDQAWLIYDEKRNYGFLYNKITIEEVKIMEDDSSLQFPQQGGITLDLQEQKYADLWKAYFKSTNIKARRNMKLHLRHVPKRYWRYLTEKK